MKTDLMGWNPFDVAKSAVSSVFDTIGTAAKVGTSIASSTLPGALPQTVPKVVDTVLSTVPVVVDTALQVPIAVTTPLIKVGVEKAMQITVPQVEAPQYEPLVVPGYTKTETGEIVKEVNLKDFISLIPLSGLAWLAFAL